jgi:lipopolysaccharide/colanic/teichoic acid biosynthesis glycosyltransferase
MTHYFQYVHNLKWGTSFDNLRPNARETVVSLLLHQIENYNTLEKAILKESNPALLHHISRFIDLKTDYTKIILSTETCSYVEEVDFDPVRCIINLRNINITQRPNKLFRAVNTLLPLGGLYIGSVETYGDRKNRFFRQYGKVRGEMIWLMDYLINRVIPRLFLIDRIYFRFTRGRLHCMSTAELLGRLVYCGFKIVELKSIEGMTYFVTMKSGLPLKRQLSSYYPVISLPRIGKEGRMMNLYKIRSMHPYSEYIQDYVIRKNGYNEAGKPANDFRITRIGKLLRRLWIDELPQIIHVLKGDMKLVGVRPLSETRFQELPDDLKFERIKYKPGCIAPYVALNMPGDLESIEAERIYIENYKRHPILTDIGYFFKGVTNIFLNKVKHN